MLDPGLQQHVVTPLVCLEMHAALMRCAGHAKTMLSEQMETEHLEGDHARLERYERGVFEVTDMHLNEVPPYQNDEFMQQVQLLVAFDHVRAAPPAQAGAATVLAGGRDWSEGEHPKHSKQHNQPGRALTSLDCPYSDWPAGIVRSPRPEPALLFSRDAHRHTPEVAADVVAPTCERLLTLHEPGLRPTCCQPGPLEHSTQNLQNPLQLTGADVSQWLSIPIHSSCSIENYSREPMSSLKLSMNMCCLCETAYNYRRPLFPPTSWCCSLLEPQLIQEAQTCRCSQLSNNVNTQQNRLQILF